MAVRLPSPADSYQTSGEVLQDFPNKAMSHIALLKLFFFADSAEKQ